MFLFASSLTPWLGFVGLVATVVVATQVEDAVVALTVVVVVLTIYLVVTEPKQRFEQRGLFWRYLADAVYEAAHNLEHIAKVFTAAGQLQRWPDFHLRAAGRLLDPPFNDYVLRLAPSLWPHLDHIVRNDVQLQRYPFTPEGAHNAEDVLAHFVEHCLRFIIAAGRASEWNAGPHVIAVIEHLGCPELTRLALAGDDERFHIRISQELARWNLAERKYGLSGTEQAVYWFGDEKDPRALLYAFRKLSDPPPRPGFAKSVIQV